MRVFETMVESAFIPGFDAPGHAGRSMQKIEPTPVDWSIHMPHRTAIDDF